VLKRLFSIVVLSWVLGFVWFAMSLPRPAGNTKTDAVIVLTGGEGRIARGVEVLDKGWSAQLFVSGVDREVKPAEFVAQFRLIPAQLDCCITLDFKSVDTRSNAREASRWLAGRNYKSVRLITSDWHMRRAAFELHRAISPGVLVVEDAVVSHPSLGMLIREYHKWLARLVSQLWGG
jgi:uncharacterized SAM-binding protein YcdF (DUF218 family)